MSSAQATRQRIWRYARYAAVLAIVAATGFVVPSRADGVLNPQGPIAAAERLILFDATAIMLVIVVPVMVATCVVAWWFRASNERARRQLTWAFSGRLELLIWSIPALVILFLGGIAWISAHDLDPAQPLNADTPALEIDVVSLDWKWLFIYPRDGVASINHLVLPVGVPIRFRVTSATVWNVFWVPQLGSMLYCMNGMAATLNLEADHPGVYQGQSAMISGDGFSGMHFETNAVPAAEYADWVRQTRAAGPALDTESYRSLLQQQADVRPYTYRSVSPRLFDAIVMQQLPPGAGPSQGDATAQVRPRSAT